MISSLYKTSSFHKRFSPRKHAFDYKYFNFFLNLKELKSLENKSRFIGINRKNIYSFYDHDHFLNGKKTILESIDSQIEAVHPGFIPHEYYLIANLRTLGHIFNPVCFYFIYDQNGDALIITEVMNTYREYKIYITSIVKTKNKAITHTQKFEKEFYVSPFSSSKGQMEYTFDFTPEEKFYVGVRNFENGIENLYANLSGRKLELSNTWVIWTIFRYPLVTLMIWLSIHFHALLLFIKKIKYYSKNEEIESQKKDGQWQRHS